MKKLSKQGLQLSWLETIALGSAKSFAGLGMGLLGARYLKPKQQERVGSVFLGLGFVAGFFVLRGLSCELVQLLKRK